MPVHDGSGSNQDERPAPPRPERSQRNPEQLVQGSQSIARPLRVQSEQLPPESQVFEDEVPAGAKRADDPPEEMPEPHNHGKNIIGTIRIQLCAKSFILRVYDVLARHRQRLRVFAKSFASGPRTRTATGLLASCGPVPRSPYVPRTSSSASLHPCCLTRLRTSASRCLQYKDRHPD